MPTLDVMLLVFAVLEIAFSGYLGRILERQWMRSPESITRSAIWIDAGAAVVGLVDYGLLLAGYGSPLTRLFG